MAATQFSLIRHGPMDHDGRILGQRDLPCSNIDPAQLGELAATLPDDPVWVTTPLLRARQTMEALRSRLRATHAKLLIVPELQEQDFGDWTGLRWDDVARRDPVRHDHFWRDPVTEIPPGGESFAALIARVKTGLAKLAEDHAGRNIVAVVHAGTIRAALSACGTAPHQTLSLTIPYLSIINIDWVASMGHGHILA